MTERPEHTLASATKRLGLVALVAGILVALLALLAPPASASPNLHPQTSVAAIAEPAGSLVGPCHSVLAVQGRERAPNYDSSATGSSVAAEDGAASSVPAQLLRGQQFEADSLQELGLTKNTASVPGGSIPDAIDNGQIWEFKDVKYQTMSQQFRNYFATGDPVNLVVNPDTVVSGPLQEQIFRSGGEILVRESPGVFEAYS
jgi:Restriction endonuclease fold toxin 7